MKNTKVKFSDKIESTYLVPYYENSEKQHLWWSCVDKYNAALLSFREIQTLLKRHPGMTYREAKKLLYQPNNISYNECNFE
jgi:hypothetical protein